MNRKDIANIVMRLFLYADMCKMIHYTTRKMHCHKLCDEVRDTIMEFADDLAEKAFGHTGKPNFNDFSLRLSVKKSSDIAAVCKNVVDLVEGLRKEIENNDKYSGIVSIIDDFKSDMAQKVYLANFDNVSDARLNEAVTKAIQKAIKESFDGKEDITRNGQGLSMLKQDTVNKATTANSLWPDNDRNSIRSPFPRFHGLNDKASETSDFNSDKSKEAVTKAINKIKIK